jgi:hypothetical protein
VSDREAPPVYLFGIRRTMELEELKELLFYINARIERLTKRAVREGTDVLELRWVDGSYPLDSLLVAKANTALAIIMKEIHE